MCGVENEPQPTHTAKAPPGVYTDPVLTQPRLEALIHVYTHTQTHAHTLPHILLFCSSDCFWLIVVAKMRIRNRKLKKKKWENRAWVRTKSWNWEETPCPLLQVFFCFSGTLPKADVWPVNCSKTGDSDPHPLPLLMARHCIQAPSVCVCACVTLTNTLCSVASLETSRTATVARTWRWSVMNGWFIIISWHKKIKRKKTQRNHLQTSQ